MARAPSSPCTSNSRMTRDELICTNLGLVHACAGRFKGKGIEYDDLYAAGCVGLIKAIDRYDPEKGYQLSTYAVPVILGEIRLLFREGGNVRISRSLQTLSVKAKRITEEYRRTHQADIRIEELAERLNTDTYKAQEALNASLSVLSLSYERDSDDNTIDIPVPGEEEALTERLSLLQTMEALTMDERELIRLRYFKHKTQNETAKELNTTQVQISRKEKKILIKMRAMLI